jgi:hypothetical protein
MTYMNTRTLTLRISEELMTELDQEAHERVLSISEVVRDRLRRSGPAESPQMVPADFDEAEDDLVMRCPHPKDKQTNVVGGKKCMVCKAFL